MGSTDVAEPVEVEEDGAPVEEGAEATRTMSNLFEYSSFVHAGAGSEDCEHREDGTCKEPGHFHAWVTLPNSLQHRDIQEKARAAKARRKRAMRDAGDEGRPASDAYVTLESELDDLMAGEREVLLSEMADRTTRKKFGEYVTDVRENDDRFENYEQDAEEYRRLVNVPEEERDAEEFKQVDELMTAFGNAVQETIEREKEGELASLRKMTDADIRDIVRLSRIEGESAEQSVHTYYTWLAFVGTRVKAGALAKRYFGSLEDLRNASPEAVDAIDGTLRELESRTMRGEATKN